MRSDHVSASDRSPRGPLAELFSSFWEADICPRVFSGFEFRA